MSSAYHGTWKTGDPDKAKGEPEAIANPVLVTANKHQANKIILVSLLIAAAATAGIFIVPLR